MKRGNNQILEKARNQAHLKFRCNNNINNSVSEIIDSNYNVNGENNLFTTKNLQNSDSKLANENSKINLEKEYELKIIENSELTQNELEIVIQHNNSTFLDK